MAEATFETGGNAVLFADPGDGAYTAGAGEGGCGDENGMELQR